MMIEIPITKEQLALLRNERERAQIAQARLNLLLAVIAAGHGLTGVTDMRLDEERLVLVVP